VLERAVRSDPEQRYASANEFYQALTYAAAASPTDVPGDAVLEWHGKPIARERAKLARRLTDCRTGSHILTSTPIHAGISGNHRDLKVRVCGPIQCSCCGRRPLCTE
jgi:hypothetical protein